MDNKKQAALIATTFTYTNPLATAVFIAGSFNAWKPDATALTRVEPARWQLKIPLPHGRHEYVFVVDGAWIVDPLAREACYPNLHGGFNAVVQV